MIELLQAPVCLRAFARPGAKDGARRPRELPHRVVEPIVVFDQGLVRPG